MCAAGDVGLRSPSPIRASPLKGFSDCPYKNEAYLVYAPFRLTVSE